MIISTLHICYHPSHEPFASEGAVKIENLNSERPALKIIRAILRDFGIDPQDAVNYSIHRCHCNLEFRLEGQDESQLDPVKTLEQLGFKDGSSVFIRKIDVEDKKESQYATTPSRKRKLNQEGLSQLDPLSSISVEKEALSSTISSDAFTLEEKEKVSHLEYLGPAATITALSISRALGGEGWKNQSIGKLGSIQTKSRNSLHALLGAVETSLKLVQLPKAKPGSFNSDLVEALNRAYHDRIHTSNKVNGAVFTNGLERSDYERATELLKGKIEEDVGSWERGNLAHLDESALSEPASRFPLSNSGLSGQLLGSARAICALWGNERWINQSPLPGLSPISLKSTSKNVILRQIAYLTRVKAGEATPDGFPPIVLRALQEAIRQRKSSDQGYLVGGDVYGWSQSRDITQALEILKSQLKEEQMAHSTSTDNRPNKKMRISSLLNPQAL